MIGHGRRPVYLKCTSLNSICETTCVNLYIYEPDVAFIYFWKKMGEDSQLKSS